VIMGAAGTLPTATTKNQPASAVGAKAPERGVEGRKALWNRDGRKLSFPYGLSPGDDIINYPPSEQSDDGSVDSAPKQENR
jgi:hypothetical protein